MPSRLHSLHSAKFLKERKRKRSILLFLATLAVLSILAALILLLRLPFLQISRVEVIGSTSLPKDQIEDTVLESLRGTYFGIIPHTNILFFPRSEIRKALKNSFVEIENFSITRSGWGKVSISLSSHVPVAIVCAGFRGDDVDQDCFWSDKRGYLFGSIASSSATGNDSAYDRFYVPSDTNTVVKGKTFIEEKRFNDLLDFMHGTSRGGLLPLGVLVGENGEYEMYIQNKNGNSEATVYFDDRSSFENTLSNLLTFWNANRAATYEYINLRFGNAVYYSGE